jgi:ribulose-5-phosphate 4-epimerase/fuculose-1-phosphate aldolase
MSATNESTERAPKGSGAAASSESPIRLAGREGLFGGTRSEAEMGPASRKESGVRADLAAAFQWAARLNLHEAVANHFSAAVSDDGSQFLLNPRGRHFSRMRASELLLLDSGTAGEGESQVHPDADPTAWYLHAHLHKTVPRARCILHTHMPYVTALTCLADFEFLMLDQNACRFHNRIAYDRHYAGMALDDTEGERVASLLGDDKSVMFLGNHGVLVIGETVAEAFDELYYLEKAAQLQVLALSTGRPLALVADDVAALACKQWLEYPEVATLHFAELKRILDEEGSNYAK